MNLILRLVILLSMSAGVAVQGAENVRLLVGYRDTEQSKQLVGRHGGQVLDDAKATRVLSVEAPLQAVAKLKAHASVRYVEVDAVVTMQGFKVKDVAVKTSATTTVPQPVQTIPWGITQVLAPSAWTLSTGAAVPVAIIDTGIDYTHPDLKGNVYAGPSYVLKVRTSQDDNGHGTHVSGTVAAVNNTIGVVGVAPKAALWGVKVLDRSGAGYVSAVVSGINWAVSNGKKIASLSLGSTSDSQTLHDACDLAVAKGVLVVAAAGNGGSTTPQYPGAYASVVCVSAADSANVLASFSTYGPQVDLAAPGVGITSTMLGGGYATWSGTSMAAPHVAGAAALVWSLNPTFLNSAVRLRLQSTATDLGLAGVDSSFGNGLVNALKAVKPN